MKHLTLFIAVLLFATNLVTAQKKASAATSPPPAATGNAAGSGSSGSSSLVQGYHYILPKKYHVAYRSVLYISPNALDATGKWIKNLSFTNFFISTTNPFLPADIQQINLKSTTKELSLNTTGVKKTDNDFYVKILDVGSMNVPTPDLTYGRIIVDTIWRYSDERQHVSVTQGDSGKLVIQFYNKIQGLKTTLKDASIAQTIQLLSGHLPANPAALPPGTIIQNFVTAMNDGKIDIKAYDDYTANAAILIKPTDSAQNFYLKIKNKASFKDPLYYIPLSYNVWQYGATSIPFRYRFPNSKLKISLPNASKVQTDYPVPSEATGNISLAAYIGKKFGATRFFYDATKSHNTASIMFSFFGGPSLIPLSANNIKSGLDINSYPSQLLTASYGAACTFEFGVLNLGFFGGIDQPLQKVPWVYSGRPWIGFGFGFNLGMLGSAGDIGYN